MKKVIFLKITAAILASAVITLTIYLFLNKNTDDTFCDDEKVEVKKTSGAMESMQFMSEIRAFPDVDIPQDKFFRAFEHSKNNMTEFTSSMGPTEWTSI